MPFVSVRAKAGRIAYDSPHGDLIPQDAYVSVEMTPWIDRLLNHHGDIELEPAPVKAKAAPAAAPTPAPAA